MTGQIALMLRVLLLYPLAGALAAFVGFVHWNPDTGTLLVDVDGASLILAAFVWTFGAGGTYGFSRLAKKLGWAT